MLPQIHFVRRLPPIIAVSSLLLLALLSASCRRDVAAAEMNNGSMASTASESASSAPVANHFDEAAFTLRIEARAPYEVGKPGVVVVELKAKDPHHINQEYPHKLKLKPLDGVTLPSSILGRESMKIAPMQAELTVPFTPNRRGAFIIGGDFAFSLCTADRCLMEKRMLAVEVQVR
jgi:hypothetical protein